MIRWEDVYKVVAAMTPLYFALMLGYGSVKWWRIFKPEQCDAINRLVCYFILPLFTLEFTANINPFQMNYRLIGADVISKLIVVVVLAFWANCSSKGTYAWSITSFSLATLTNTLLIGVPIMNAMYGSMAVDLVVQLAVVQAIIWFPIMLFVLEFRRSRISISSGKEDAGGGEKDLERSTDVAVSGRPPSFWMLMKVVGLKLAKNPRCYACTVGLAWAFLASRDLHGFAGKVDSLRYKPDYFWDGFEVHCRTRVHRYWRRCCGSAPRRFPRRHHSGSIATIYCNLHLRQRIWITCRCLEFCGNLWNHSVPSGNDRLLRSYGV
ncbi:hypothetical protein SLEP1_g58943, partial [Rubroshorea leprosula]